jgi:hypothetical protein
MYLRRVVFIVCTSIAAAGCVGHRTGIANGGSAPLMVAGVWDGVSRATLSDGAGAGDTRIEKQEWHLAQTGESVSGYYIAAMTFVSGDGRPYMCNREPQFSAVQRYDVSGRVRGGVVELQEIAQRSTQGRCDPGNRRLARYQGNVQGDVLTLIAGAHRQTLYRSKDGGDRLAPSDLETVLADAQPAEASFPSLSQPHDGQGQQGQGQGQSVSSAPTPLPGSPPADVSGLWIWEHRGAAPGGDEKQEREEWHVTQDGSKLTGYYDRVVHQVSIDGHAYRCSMSLDFQIATRYQISGEVRGDQVIIYENSFEILEPSACDNGKRRLDAYEGQASSEELRLVWGVGGQVLHRPRPDVPTQRF